MTNAVLRAAFCVLVLAGCARDGERAEEPTPDPEAIDLDGGNLLNLARGASVVSRTAELTLESSAVHAIDGDWRTIWKSPGGGTDQTFVFSLPARSRIDRVGVTTSLNAPDAPQFVSFEASDDGLAWRDVGTVAVELHRDPTLISVKPFEASYLRAHTDENFDYYTTVRSFVALGKEIAPVKQPSIAGCWTINGMPSRFIQRGSSIAGVIGTDRPMYVSGATDGRALRLMWLRGAQWGPAMVTLEPQRRALSGVRWHERVLPFNSGDGWFGTPGSASCNDIAMDEKLIETQIAARILQRAGKWVAYGDSAFDTLEALIRRSPSQHFRIVTPAAARLEIVRAALQARGVDLTRVEFAVVAPQTINEPQRVIADGVELHAR